MDLLDLQTALKTRALGDLELTSWRLNPATEVTTRKISRVEDDRHFCCHKQQQQQHLCGSLAASRKGSTNTCLLLSRMPSLRTSGCCKELRCQRFVRFLFTYQSLILNKIIPCAEEISLGNSSSTREHQNTTSSTFPRGKRRMGI